MKTKQEIVENWLPRYTQRPVKDFTKYILLTNFSKYVEIFATHFHVPILGEDSNMPSASADGVTIINFGMGSANAATVMDLLSAVKPEAVLFLGKCGGIKKVNKLGDYILPIAAIRGEGTSNDYFPPEVPALPAFMLQRAVSTAVRNHHRDYWTGTVYTTNRRVWEFDDNFKDYLRRIRCMAVDMESITDWLLTEKAEEQFAMQHPPLYVLYPVPSVTQIHNRLTPEQLLPYIIGHSALFVRQSAPKVSDKVP